MKDFINFERFSKIFKKNILSSDKQKESFNSSIHNIATNILKYPYPNENILKRIFLVEHEMIPLNTMLTSTNLSDFDGIIDEYLSGKISRKQEF